MFKITQEYLFVQLNEIYNMHFNKTLHNYIV